MDIKTLTEEVEKVSQGYAKKFTIHRDADWMIMKLQEELGELVQKHLMLTGKARTKGKTLEEIREEFHKEVADVFCQVLLLAKFTNVDVEEEVKKKWLVWNK
jgi:NTP pyrophosphatase (non-canonical NTP hydrolase)